MSNGLLEDTERGISNAHPGIFKDRYLGIIKQGFCTRFFSTSGRTYPKEMYTGGGFSGELPLRKKVALEGMVSLPVCSPLFPNSAPEGERFQTKRKSPSLKLLKLLSIIL